MPRALSLLSIAVLAAAAGCGAAPAARTGAPGPAVSAGPTASEGEAAGSRATAFPKDAEARARLDELIRWGVAGPAGDPDPAKVRKLADYCGSECSPRVRARIWITLGLFVLEVDRDEATVRQAFERALEVDPRAELDRDIATPRAAELFDAVKVDLTPPR